ncbi:MAG: SH3 domain-containing protein, partial [Chloroflexaceae bacterium]|nr:SH3 domain-containing protein [Chloroflexaceae bacterium]
PAQEVQQASVINGGNLRSEPLVAPDTVLAQICPNDTVQVLEQRDTWAQVRLVSLGPDCVAERANLGRKAGSASRCLVRSRRSP